MTYIKTLNYQIRKFEKEDLSQVMDINQKCLPENYPTFFYMELYYSFPELFLVATDKNNKVVGYILYRVETGFSSFGFFHGLVKKAHLISIAVLPEYRQNGIGTVLLKKSFPLLTEFYKCNECYLEVRTSNSRAIELYEKLGYTITKTTRSYYQDRESAYTMSIKII